MTYATSHFVVPPSGLRSGGTLSIARPAGIAASDIAGIGHHVVVAGSIYSSPSHFTITNGASLTTLTWLSSTLPAGAQGHLVLALSDSDPRPASRVFVTDFGAIGDGVTDCRAAFLAARDSIPAGAAGEVVVPYVPGASTYLLSSSITGQSGNFVRWVIEDGASISPSIGARISGAQYWRESKSSQSQAVQIKGAPDAANGNSIERWTQIENIGPSNGNGRRLGYVSYGYGQGTFDIADFIVARWERDGDQNHNGQHLAQWLACITPNTIGTQHKHGVFCAEWNIVNRGDDTGWSKRRSTLDQWTGIAQLVPEASLFGAPTGTAGNITFGMVFTWGQGDDGGRGYVPRFYTHLLHEPNSVHEDGYAVYASGSDGADTLPGGGPSQAYLGLDDQWKWGLKFNDATFTRETIALGADHKIGWIDGSDALLNGIYSGTGTPEGAVAAPVGSLYLRRDGGAGTTLYVKQSGTGNTGWAAK